MKLRAALEQLQSETIREALAHGWNPEEHFKEYLEAMLDGEQAYTELSRVVLDRSAALDAPIEQPANLKAYFEEKARVFISTPLRCPQCKAAGGSSFLLRTRPIVETLGTIAAGRFVTDGAHVIKAPWYEGGVVSVRCNSCGHDGTYNQFSTGIRKVD